MDLAAKFAAKKLRANEIAVFWLGQAGFLIKDSSGRSIAIDPYLTDCCERLANFKRLSPKLITPEKLKVDVLFTTHDHPDHFDVDAVPCIMKNSKTILIGSVTSANMAMDMGVKKDRAMGMSEGDVIDLGWVRFQAVYADHGDLAPDAIGVIIFIEGVTLYYTGDTAYRPENMQAAIEARPDIVILPINGAFGNLNSEEAAMLVRDTHSKMAVPCHFWTFAAHGGSPQQFQDVMKRVVPDTQVKFLYQGEGFDFPK